MSRTYSEGEARKRSADELERLNKSREWLRNYNAAMLINSTNKSGEKINMPTSEAAE